MTPEGDEGGKSIMKINLSMQEIEPWSPAQKARVLTSDQYTFWSLVLDGVDCENGSDKIKYSISPPLHYPKLRQWVSIILAS